VAEAEMLRALRVMTVQRGLDPREFALLAFGGAGPLHACALASELGIRRILCPRASGVLSAFGLAAAAPRRDAARSVMLAGESLSTERLQEERSALAQRASEALGRAPTRIAVSYELRYRGQSFELAVAEENPANAGDLAHLGGSAPRTPPSPDALREAFACAHERRYGYRDDDAEIELVTLRASAWGAAPDGARLVAQDAHGALAPGTRMRGPTVCALEGSTLLVASGWEGEVDAFGTVRLFAVGERA
jgi:N-methylhydantoinase A